jgi:hypothetical protein
MTQPSPPATIPIFSAPDFDTAARFYGALGFVETGRWGDYLILVHPLGIELHFDPEHGHDADHHHTGACYVRFDTAEGARSLHDAWAAAGSGCSADRAGPTPYGLLEFTCPTHSGMS